MEDFRFQIRFKSRFRKNKTIIESLPSPHATKSFASYCFNQFSGVEDIRVTDRSGGFVLLYKE